MCEFFFRDLKSAESGEANGRQKPRETTKTIKYNKITAKGYPFACAKPQAIRLIQPLKEGIIVPT